MPKPSNSRAGYGAPLKYAPVVALGAIAAGCFFGNGGPGNNNNNPPDASTGVSPTASEFPGLRRLTNAEYNNTVRDLIGGSTQSFPADNVAPSGFDNEAALLTIGDTLFSQYVSSADALLKAALWVPHPVALTIAPKTLSSGCDVYDCDPYNNTNYVQMWADDTKGLHTFFTVQDTGDYQISVQAFETSYSPTLTINVDGAVAGSFTVTALQASPKTYQATVTLHAGQHQLAVLNGSTSNTYQYDLIVGQIAINGPAQESGSTAMHDKIMNCGTAAAGSQACATTILTNFTQRAWRRPVTSDEVNRLYALVTLAQQQGDTFDAGIQLALKAVMLSPNFLYRVEIDPDPTSTAAHPISDYELASRLSYFVWSSMPDDALFQAAQAGNLHDPQVLVTQLNRMLADPKAQALTDNFASPWLNLRVLDQSQPDPKVYPSFNAGLRTSMEGETRAFFQEFLNGDESALDMVDAPFTFANQQLATYYNLPGVTGTTFQKVALDPNATHRGGLLTQAAILTSTSISTRSSIARRGKWVLSDLLCSTPPPPPPGIPPLPMTASAGETQRQLMEQHASAPSCAGCHNLIDPIGFGLENYDGIGSWRTTDNGSPIDASATTIDGHSFTGPMALAQLIKSDPRLPSCIVQKFFGYVYGREITTDDTGALTSISSGFASDSYRLKALLVRIIHDPTFTTRRGNGT